MTGRAELLKILRVAAVAEPSVGYLFWDQK